MNIFFLSSKPRECAEFHCDKHVVKMIVEYCQLLSTAHHLCSTNPPAGIYKSTHQNHPSAIWVREGVSNYTWLHRLLKHLCSEYTHRYGRIHKCESSGLVDKLWRVPIKIPKGATQPKLAMPDDVRGPDPVVAYRNLYATHKQDLLVWTNRDMPKWLVAHGFVQRDL